MNLIRLAILWALNSFVRAAGVVWPKKFQRCATWCCTRFRMGAEPAPFQYRDLSRMVERMLHDAVKQVVEAVVSSPHPLAQSFVTKVLNCCGEFISGAKRVLYCGFPAGGIHLPNQGPVLLRRHGFHERRHRYAAHARQSCLCPHSNMERQFPNGMRSSNWPGMGLLVTDI